MAVIEYRLLCRDRSSRGIRIAARSEAAINPGTLGAKERERSTAGYRER